MKNLLFVSLVALTLAADAKQYAVAQAPALQKGVNVQLATARNATPMPDADKEDAKIVTVCADGSLYFGVDPIALTDLPEKVQSTPFIRGQKLYIKADARTPYARVLEVLEATGTGGIAPQVLLSARTGPSTPGRMAPPEGVEVQLGPPVQNSR
jgi:biopolymer transport protein ExbD